ncbi:hypothetical protein JHK82_034208 [Glycine max]|nr:hypothetical protein JHK85_034923 [Glycine max]KAG4986587.1 hypothetical protein JHK86_034278 [Glycine max]KAG5119788.1 hypothetical protein JHK82_034208 [Glycine max]KAG5140780.1 hypothetical protein JHK84_034548 [Glycine max]
MAESIRSTSSLDHLEAAITHFAVTLASKASKLDALLLKMNTLVTSQHSPSSSSTKSPPPDTPILTQSPMLILLPCPALMQQIPTHMLAPLPMAASHFPAKSKSHTSSSDFGHLDHARATVSFDNLFSVVLHYDHATAPNDKTLEDRDMTMFDMVAEHHFYGSDMMVAQRCHPADFALWKATKPGNDRKKNITGSNVVRGSPIGSEGVATWWSSRMPPHTPRRTRWSGSCRGGLRMRDWDDFKPVLCELLATHPGLEFLQSTPKFQERYGLSSILVITLHLGFISGNGRLTLRELKCQNIIDVMLHADEEEDINKFWELDTDHDFLIDNENLIRYVIKAFVEDAYFDSLQYYLKFPEGLPLFENILCQIIDMIGPEDESYITLRDLKGSKLSVSVFNILVNLNKFMAFETRDPFLIHQERENPTLAEWDALLVENILGFQWKKM